NSVQPYCRFAIITMQTMPTVSCSHRFARQVVSMTEVCVSVFCMPSVIVPSFGLLSHLDLPGPAPPVCSDVQPSTPGALLSLSSSFAPGHRRLFSRKPFADRDDEHGADRGRAPVQ